MTNSITALFTTYLIYPVLGVVMLFIAAVIAKKNSLLKNKRLIGYTLISVFLLAAPALLGFLNYGFMPYIWIVLAVCYFAAGRYNDLLLAWVFNNDHLKYRMRIIYTLFQLVSGMLFFTLIFNLCNGLKYGIWASASMLPFVLASLLWQACELFVRIPAKIYKVWNYNTATGYPDPDNIDHSKLKVVMIELLKQETDIEPVRINAKIPEEMPLGDWVKLVFEDYNKKTPQSPIDISGNENRGWIFYLQSWALAPRRYLDYDLTVRKNRIRERNLIIAKRVTNIITE
jgi:hypothetical protein